MVEPIVSEPEELDEAADALELLIRRWGAQVRVKVRAGSIKPEDVLWLQAQLVPRRVYVRLVTYSDAERELLPLLAPPHDSLFFEPEVA